VREFAPPEEGRRPGGAGRRVSGASPALAGSPGVVCDSIDRTEGEQPVVRFLAATDCNAPYWCQSPFSPNGSVADRMHSVFLPLFIISCIVFFGVAGVIVYAALRFRRKYDDEEPAQVHGNNKLEIAWTIAPFGILIALFINTAINMPFINNVNSADAKAAGLRTMSICTQGERFLWKYFYYNDAVLNSDDQNACSAHKQIDPNTGKANYAPKPSDGVVSSSFKLIVPVKTDVKLTIVSIDVNHSFYIPSIGGQVNAIPGQDNDLWFEVDDPGVYHGACLELCGTGHANMLIEVDALSQTDYDTWYQQQKQKAQQAASGATQSQSSSSSSQGG
jgi:cytochrome c oxidase subunit II